MRSSLRTHAAGATRVDAVVERVVTELNIFGKWLADNNAQGVISEIGWPNNADPMQWNRVALEWFKAANTLNLPVLSFSAQGPGTNVSQLTMYTRSSGSVSGGQNIDTPCLQATVAEANLGTQSYWRGIDVFGGAANDGGGYGNSAIMNNTSQNTWWYETPGTYQYLASRGYTVARVGFKWERLQPTLFGALDSAELGRLQTTVSNAANAGMKVVLDLHNYCRYATASGVNILGTTTLPVSALFDVWTRIATAFKNNSSVLAYSLMNEPHDMPNTPLGEQGRKLWEMASQGALDAIRATGDTHEVHVSVYGWGHAPYAPSYHPTGWIKDPANKFRYEAHHYLYFNRLGAANYPDPYQVELQNAHPTWVRVMGGNNTWAQWANLKWTNMEA